MTTAERTLLRDEHDQRIIKALTEALKRCAENAYIELPAAVVCRWCRYRTEIGGGHIHADACPLANADAALALAKEAQGE